MPLTASLFVGSGKTKRRVTEAILKDALLLFLEHQLVGLPDRKWTHVRSAIQNEAIVS